ncbi:MAG TPA: FAD-binding protein, partial [Acidimicrobiales bacterium]|nr:FAD-binding protein [Acidimicrobiales bacterium]
MAALPGEGQAAGGVQVEDRSQGDEVLDPARPLVDQDVEFLYLDATGLDEFATRFPTIAASLSEVGLDPASDWLPIAPAAHYSCGGVLTDLNGASSLPGLWAAGEVSCSGVHGA